MVAQEPQGGSQPAGKLLQRGVEFRGSGGVDYAQYGLGLRQVDSPGEKCAERKLTRLGRSCAAGADGPLDGFQQRWRARVWISATGWPV